MLGAAREVLQVQVLRVLPPDAGAEDARLDLQVARQVRRRQVRLFDLDALQVGDGQEDVGAEVGIDDRLQRQLDLLRLEAGRLRIVAALDGAGSS